MPTHFIHLKEVALRNNCPICYNNDGLHLSFEQRVIDNKFYKQVTSETTHSLNCKTCKSSIYPVQWTDDIEQVVEYHKKAFTPKKTDLKLKPTSWMLIMVMVLITAVITYLLLYK